MNPKIHLKICAFLIVLVILVGGCTPAPETGAEKPGAALPESQVASGVETAPVTATVASPEPERSYSDEFVIRFEGKKSSWGYNMTSRNAKGLREIRLSIDGVKKKDNPGDIRLVTDGATTWMKGEGTDNECIQYPNGADMNPTFIVPETLFPLSAAESLLGQPVEEDLSGRSTLHYSGADIAQGNWKKATIDIWLDKTTQKLVRFSMKARGKDPFFGVGAGDLSATYQSSDYVEGEIKAVKGCAVDAPLPETTEVFVRLPGMASFESALARSDMVAFYQDALVQAGWAELEPLAEDEGTIVLSYGRGDQELEIQVESRDPDGSKVKLLFTK